MKIIDGKEIAKNLRLKISEEVKKLDRPPGLAVILVGEDPASAVYVRNKERACNEAGFFSDKIIKSENITEEQLLEEVERLNHDPQIDGILVQLPLPSHINANKVIEHISPLKDVDGFHSENIGKLMQNKSHLRPCTPKGVMTMLASIGCEVMGMNCVVIGASNIVGRPMAMELLNARGTVTICNSKTKNVAEKVMQADIVVVGVGIPKMVKGDWVKDGAVVIDIGINRLDDGSLVGDVDFDAIKDKASAITPVPGGVGPMTIATLLENTLIAYRQNL
ncbi:bifunctional methylenetetrahydrofolate dehydrogenase/methenyltetrahydrofolate cyclohydrolase FolD [Candidatus Thioglobus sp. NP1]|jgi:methylenetetrahydrofolate dehydrogenase (NADP+)/methenyltetrahydrofolate cyclohydrolase|uniref:bifunctional methylenetetrahydrofolate dehydrogenase/methenyltetrahydrofolate cyclohydrolase FolD n=1 Tax=Candidatus Thioglobus sp. NP1 TaxID=2508687 RepID=UPI000DEE0BB0|nr:bifunctional methylenetetrahydrofolate dehydrogenase/methenyltetrahydrofolate cyclohydrolase FolD [Candidatus Thioglobus sp. NP1]AXE61769.1 bifunctional methylenetetrahydrofolate dehydrogenase/methenyltetrahydrofolate cyclohydrolase FolD [Candidatus Thioglobus sp. NP1]|tara:strand:- start:806 stop:1639 length:834 start_codon:yes stop_codon:yes gene_type:complete